MIGIVIASHGHLAEEFLATARQIIGDISAIATCSVDPAASAETLKNNLREALKTVDDGDGVIVFADLVGGSPCTQSLSLCQQAPLEVVTGVNLPMLLKANSLRQTVRSLPELASQLTGYGQRSITCATQQLRERIAG